MQKKKRREQHLETLTTLGKRFGGGGKRTKSRPLMFPIRGKRQRPKQGARKIAKKNAGQTLARKRSKCYTLKRSASGEKIPGKKTTQTGPIKEARLCNQRGGPRKLNIKAKSQKDQKKSPPNSKT